MKNIVQKEPLKGKVLYIEDDPTNQLFVKYGLKKEGYGVDVSVDTIGAVDIIMNNSYDWIIMDINLPKMNGTEIVSKLRARERKLQCSLSHKVIAVTAYSQPHEKREILAFGFDDLLTKPFTIEQLVSKLMLL